MMANFTMEVREMMNQPLISGVFTFDYEFYSDNVQDKETFEKLFVSHFYFREIGFETPERFKVKLQSKLNLIMPYYRQLALTEWDKVRSIEQMMESKNLTETTEHIQSIQGNSETQSNQSSSSNATQNATSTNESKASNLADGVSQSSLDDGYLTAAGKTEQTDNTQTESSGTGSQTLTGNNEQQLTEKTTFTSNGDIGIQTPAYAIAEWRKIIININQMIINECEDLFLKIY